MEEAIADGRLVMADAGLTIRELQLLSEIKQEVPKERQEELESAYVRWKSYCDNHRYYNYLWRYTECSEYSDLLQCLSRFPNSEYLLYDKFIRNDFLSILPIKDMALNVGGAKSALWNSIIDAPYQEGVIKTSQYNVTFFIKSVLNSYIVSGSNEKENDIIYKVNIASEPALVTVEVDLKLEPLVLYIW